MALFAISYTYLFSRLLQVERSVSEVSASYSSIQNNFTEELFKDHLALQNQQSVTENLNVLQSQLDELLIKNENVEYQKIQEIYTNYAKFKENLERNDQVKLDVAGAKDKVGQWGDLLINKEFDNLLADILLETKVLEDSYSEYLASLPPPPSAPTSTDGYSYTTVSTSRGTFGVALIKMPLSEVKVVTASANSDDCDDNCPTKSLAAHISDNDGFAGINGAYFCPPDYSECSGKVNSSDYAFYKSSSNKWLNKGALSWGDTGLATFNGNSPRFYKKSSDYGGGSVTAGISNYPTLLQGGNIVINESKLTSYQKTAKGPRGVIGVGKTNIYLAIINGATVIDAAYASQALGMQDALNLDGGGSSALYINGGYVVGPGRSLPNAVVLKK